MSGLFEKPVALAACRCQVSPPISAHWVTRAPIGSRWGGVITVVMIEIFPSIFASVLKFRGISVYLKNIVDISIGKN